MSKLAMLVHVLVVPFAAFHLSGSGIAKVDSAYSTLDFEDGCTVLDSPADGEAGAWVRMVCDGYRGYPVFYAQDDLRASLTYGFSRDGADPANWHSFTGFNRVDSTIEWRRAETDGGMRPFATVHRWYVHAEDGGERSVLVVSRVAQPSGDQGCVVGYVDAQADAAANARARQVADDVARDFRCGTDVPSYHGATTPATPRPSR